MTADDNYLVKLKNAKLPDHLIAAKLGISVEEVQRRWCALFAEFQSMQANGYQNLIDQFTVLSNQYQLLGQSLMIIGNNLGGVLTTEELEALVVEDREQTLQNLRTKCIILRPVPLVDPQEFLKEGIKKN